MPEHPRSPSRPTSAQWTVLTAALLGWMFDGLEMGIFPLVARPALLDLLPGADDALVGLWMGRITALFLLGAACGGLVFGWLGDRIGRVRAMALSILTYSVFSGLCWFASAPWHLGALRFVSALGMGGEWSLGVALVMEVWPARHHAWLAGLIGSMANIGVGLIAAAGLVLPVRQGSWRWVMLAGAVPALLTFFVRLFVPESERWKTAARRASGDPLRRVLAPPLLTRTLLAVSFAAIALIGTWGSVQWIPLWVDRLTGGTQPLAKAWAQIISAGGAALGCFGGAWLGGRFGRRPAYFLLCLASLVLTAALFRGDATYGPRLLGMIFLVGAATAAFYGWLPLYLPELFPTAVRATGQGLGFNAGRVLAAGGALWSGVLVHGVYGGDYARMGSAITLIYALGLVLIWLAPETRGRPLPD